MMSLEIVFLVVSHIVAFTVGFAICRGIYKDVVEELKSRVPTMSPLSPMPVEQAQYRHTAIPILQTPTPIPIKAPTPLQKAVVASSVMKYPKPEDVRKRKEREALESYEQYSANNDRDSGFIVI